MAAEPNDNVSWSRGNSQAGEFLRTQLALGPALGTACLEQIDLGSGYLKVYAPSGASSVDFESGVFGREEDAHNAVVAEMIEPYLKLGTDRHLVFESATFRRGDPSTKRLQVPLVFSQDAVLFFLGQEEQPLTLDVVKHAWGYPTIGLLTKAAPGSIKNGQDLPPAGVSDLIRNVQSVFVSAFDGEGVVAWVGDHERS